MSGVNEDWEHQVTPLLHEMTNCGGVGGVSGGNGSGNGGADDDYFNPHEVSERFHFTTHSPLQPLVETPFLNLKCKIQPNTFLFSSIYI